MNTKKAGDIISIEYRADRLDSVNGFLMTPGYSPERPQGSLVGRVLTGKTRCAGSGAIVMVPKKLSADRSCWSTARSMDPKKTKPITQKGENE